MSESSLVLPCLFDYRNAIATIVWTSDDIIVGLNKIHWLPVYNLSPQLNRFLSNNLVSFTPQMSKMLSTSPPDKFSSLFLDNLGVFKKFGFDLDFNLLNEIERNKIDYKKQMIKMGMSEKDSNLVISGWLKQIAGATGIKPKIQWELASTPNALKYLISEATPSDLRDFPWT